MTQKKMLFAFLMSMATVYAASSAPQYLGIGGLFEQPRVLIFTLDSLGNFAPIGKIAIPCLETRDIEVGNTGRLILIPGLSQLASLLHITPSMEVRLEPLSAMTYIWESAITPDHRYAIIERSVLYGGNVEVYRIESDDTITSTGYYLHYTMDNPGPTEIAVSKRGNVVLGHAALGLVFIFRLYSDGRIEDTGERIDVSPYQSGQIDIEIARNGAFAVAGDLGRAAVVEIDPEGNVSYNGNYIEHDYPRIIPCKMWRSPIARSTLLLPLQVVMAGAQCGAIAWSATFHYHPWISSISGTSLWNLPLPQMIILCWCNICVNLRITSA